MNNKKQYIFIIILYFISGCALINNNKPVKTNNFQSAVKPMALPFDQNSNKNLSTTSKPVSKVIKESRVNGQVTKIKVENGKYLPDYYIYPSDQKKLNINYGPDKDLAPPSWQISW